MQPPPGRRTLSRRRGGGRSAAGAADVQPPGLADVQLPGRRTNAVGADAQTKELKHNIYTHTYIIATFIGRSRSMWTIGRSRSMWTIGRSRCMWTIGRSRSMWTMIFNVTSRLRRIRLSRWSLFSLSRWNTRIRNQNTPTFMQMWDM